MVEKPSWLEVRSKPPSLWEWSRNPPVSGNRNTSYNVSLTLFVVGMVVKPSRLGVSGETSTFSGWDTAYVPLEGWLARSN